MNSSFEKNVPQYLFLGLMNQSQYFLKWFFHCQRAHSPFGIIFRYICILSIHLWHTHYSIIFIYTYRTLHAIFYMRTLCHFSSCEPFILLRMIYVPISLNNTLAIFQTNVSYISFYYFLCCYSVAGAIVAHCSIPIFRHSRSRCFVMQGNRICR